MNYKESTVAGTEYQRARLVEIHNQLNVAPHVSFLEERVTVLPDRTITQDLGQISTAYQPSAVIPLINPETGEPLTAYEQQVDPVTQEVTMVPVGEQLTMTHQQVMVAVYSLYVQLVQARDYVPPAVESPPVVDTPPPVIGGGVV